MRADCDRRASGLAMWLAVETAGSVDGFMLQSSSMDFLKSIAGRIVSGLVGLLVIAVAISWWRMEPATRQALMGGAGRIAAWIGVVLLWPWASFAIVAWVGRMRSNLAGGVLVGTYSLLEFLLLLWLMAWSIGGAVAWTFVGVGMLAAIVYNVLTCDWIAERVG